MHAFLTGSSGFLGRALLAHLLAQGDRVTVLVRTFEQMQALPAGVRARAGDVAQPETWQSALRGVDVVYHLAATRPTSATLLETARVERVNITGTQRVLELATAAQVQRIVFVGDAMIYGRPQPQPITEDALPPKVGATSLYQRTRQNAQFTVVPQFQAQGTPILTAVLSTLFGPRDPSLVGALVRRLQRSSVPGFTDGDARQWLAVEDAAQALRLVAERGTVGETYFFAGPAALTVPQLFNTAPLTLRRPWLWLPSVLLTLPVELVRRLMPRWVARVPFWPPPTPLLQTTKAQTLGWQARPVAEVWPNYLKAETGKQGDR